MNVVHISNGSIPIPPGDIAASTEEHIYLLTQNMAQLGCNVHVIGIKGGKPQEPERQQSKAIFHDVWWPPLPSDYTYQFLHRLNSYILFTSKLFLFSSFSAIPMSQLLSKEKIDVIHFYNPNVALIYIIAGKLRRKRPVIVYCPFNPYGLTKFSWPKRIAYFAEVLSLKWVDHIIASNESVNNWLVNEFKLDPQKITQICTGTDVEGVEKLFSQKKQVNHHSNILLCTGKVCKRKNQFTAVKAMIKVLSEHPDIKLVFTGPCIETDYMSLMQDFISQNGLSAYVEFRGEVTKQELYQLYSDALMFLFPTTAEIDPSSLKEALIFGLPVIASDIKSIADVIVKEKESAILIDPYDVDRFASAVIRLLNDDNLRQNMSEKATKLGQSFSYQSIANQTLAMYEKLVRA